MAIYPYLYFKSDKFDKLKLGSDFQNAQTQKNKLKFSSIQIEISFFSLLNLSTQ